MNVPRHPNLAKSEYLDASKHVQMKFHCAALLQVQCSESIAAGTKDGEAGQAAGTNARRFPKRKGTLIDYGMS